MEEREEKRLESPVEQSGKAEEKQEPSEEIANTKVPAREEDKESFAEEKKGKKSGVAKAAIIVIVVGLIALSAYRLGEAFVGKEAEEDEQILTNVEVQEVGYGTVEITSPLSGRIEPNEEVAIIPMTAGEVTSVSVSEGDYVKKGATLFKIDTTQAQLSLEQAKAAYNVAKNGVDAAKLNFDRMSMLFAEGAIAAAEYDAAESQYKSASLSLAQAQVAIDQASEALTYGVVTAPISGYVTAVNVVPGGLASQASAAMMISDTSSLKINTTVSEYLISSVKEKDKVDVYIRSVSEEPFKGTVTNVIPTPATGTLTYPITVTLDKKNSDVMSGMFAEIIIISDKKEKVITVPSDAIIVKNNASIAVVLEEGLPVYKEVTVGLDNGTVAEITSGLKQGELLIVKGQNYVLEGEEVHVVNGNQEAEQED